MHCLSFLAVCLALFSLPNTQSANIMGLFTSTSPSHLIIHMSVVKALAEQGHNITVVTTLKPTITHQNIKVLQIELPEEDMKLISHEQSNATNTDYNIWQTMKLMWKVVNTVRETQETVVQDPKVLNLIKNSQFDLLIFGYFMNDFALAIAEKLQCPVIISWMLHPVSMVNTFIGNPDETAYTPNFDTVARPGHVMPFFTRVKNQLSTLVFQGVALLQYFNNKAAYERIIPRGKGRSFDEMKRNVSLLFCNSHFSEGLIRPNVPAVIEIGGIQIKEKPDPLPKNIAEFLDNSSENGAVLLSLGSNIQSNLLKPEKIEALFNTLSKLKQNVIWKWEDVNNTPGNASNILFIKWVPQDDILAHPNLKLFITHAGKGGITEAQYHAVPMVAIPATGDQPANAAAMEASGYGVKLDFPKLNEKDLQKAIKEVLENPVYKENLKRFSTLYRDRPATAKQSVVYWTEYVLKYRGAAHMQSPKVYMNDIQALGLDVYAFFLAIILTCFYLVKLGKKLVCKKLCKKRSSQKGQKKKTH